jgi:long-chain acyl-CoA synthetase
MNTPTLVSDLLFDTYASHPNIPALGYAGEDSFSYAAFAATVDALAARLRNDGITPGARVAIVSENMPNWGVAYLAINRMGAVVVPVLPDFPADDIARILEHAEASAVFVSKKLRAKTDEALAGRSAPVLYQLDDLPLDTTEAPHSPDPSNRHDGSPDDLAAIIYTSGTTGHSKGVMLSNRSLVFDALEAAKIPGFTPGDAMISILPLAHTYECTIGFLVPVSEGASIYYLRRPPSATVLMPALEKVRPHLMLSVPLLIEKIYRQSVLPSIMKKPITRRLYGTRTGRRLLNRVAGGKLKKTFGGRLYFFGIGGAALNPEVEQFLREARFPYCVGYGLTETAPLIAGANAKNQVFRSTGKPLEGIEVRISNPDEKTGEGEIIVRGPIVMQGYYRDPERTAEVIDSEGWFHTGDLGVIDKGGRLYIKGRSKNVIIGPSGENIYPEAIEGVINSFEFVEESLVYSNEGQLQALIHINYDALKEHLERLGGNVAGTVRDAAGSVRDAAGSVRDAAVSGADTVGEFLADLRDKVNARLSSFSRIKSVEEQKEPFEKTPTNKVKRFLYDKGRDEQGDSSDAGTAGDKPDPRSDG